MTLKTSWMVAVAAMVLVGGSVAFASAARHGDSETSDADELAATDSGDQASAANVAATDVGVDQDRRHRRHGRHHRRGHRHGRGRARGHANHAFEPSTTNESVDSNEVDTEE